MRWEKHVLIVLMIFTCHMSFAQPWHWANQIGSFGDDGIITTVDQNGNVYCFGYFEYACYFQTDTLVSYGDNDLFIAKYDPNGLELWVKQIGGNNIGKMEKTSGIICDKLNNVIYVTGMFCDTLIIDGFSLASYGLEDMFIAKFDFSGNCLWLKGGGSSSTDIPCALTIDANGNVLCAGVMGSTGVFNSSPISKCTFLYKMDSNGTLIWLKDSAFIDAYPTAMFVSNNEIFITGQTRNDTSYVDTTQLLGTIQTSCFFAKLTLMGSSIWAKKIDYQWSLGYNIKQDIDNNLIAVGSFFNSIAFGSIVLANSNRSDMYIFKFDPDGNPIWAKQSFANGIYGAFATNIDIDPSGFYYVTGMYSGVASFGNINLTASNYEMFLEKLDTAGNTIGVHHFPNSEPWSCDLLSNGNLVISGMFIGSTAIGSQTLNSFGLKDIFITISDPITDVGEKNHKDYSELYIYANPSSGQFNVKIPTGINNSIPSMLYINDLKGSVIKSQEIFCGKDLFIDMPEAIPGTYSVRIIQDDKVYHGKLIIN
jgi:hypothetical protein